MYKVGLKGFAVIALCSMLMACQPAPKRVGVSAPVLLSSSGPIALTSTTPKGLIGLHCSGALGCEFARLNNMTVIDEVSRQPTSEAIEAAVVRFESANFSNAQYAKHFITMRPGRHEVRVRFYPVTRERAENFTLIHDFRSDRTYRLYMFRQRGMQQSSSLLSAATPEPLCIDLLENDKALRRFCRPFDPATGLGEFVEQKLGT